MTRRPASGARPPARPAGRRPVASARAPRGRRPIRRASAGLTPGPGRRDARPAACPARRIYGLADSPAFRYVPDCSSTAPTFTAAADVGGRASTSVRARQPVPARTRSAGGGRRRAGRRSARRMSASRCRTRSSSTSRSASRSSSGDRRSRASSSMATARSSPELGEATAGRRRRAAGHRRPARRRPPAVDRADDRRPSTSMSRPGSPRSIPATSAAPPTRLRVAVNDADGFVLRTRPSDWRRSSASTRRPCARPT